ncbi:MAG: hypothetical protein R3B66_03140 [Candidatus Scalinduaceae bacterium]
MTKVKVKISSQPNRFFAYWWSKTALTTGFLPEIMMEN